MTKEYSDCFYCGGAVEEQLLPRELRWQGQLFIFENVPMGVCTQCREKFLKPEVAKAIDRVLREQRKPARTVQVPVYLYGNRSRGRVPVIPTTCILMDGIFGPFLRKSSSQHLVFKRLIPRERLPCMNPMLPDTT